MPLHISQFKINQVAFQVRYRDAYLLFDRTGLILEEAKKLWPSIRLENAQPKISKFLIEDKYTLQLELNQASINALTPEPSLEKYIDYAHKFETIVRRILEIVEYKRVGFRVFYLKEYKTKEEATKDIISSLGLKAPQGKHFNIQGQTSVITFNQRWEDEFFGVLSELRSQEQSWEFTPPKEAEGLEPMRVSKRGIYYAIDYYTLAPLSVGKLDTNKWLNNAFHMIKRDSKIFLEK